MSKTDLVNFIAEKAGLTKVDAAKALDAFECGVTEGLKKSKRVSLTGFFTFTAVDQPAKTARNPRTGETVSIPAKVAVKAKAGSKIKEALN